MQHTQIQDCAMAPGLGFSDLRARRSILQQPGSPAHEVHLDSWVRLTANVRCAFHSDRWQAASKPSDPSSLPEAPSAQNQTEQLFVEVMLDPNYQHGAEPLRSRWQNGK